MRRIPRTDRDIFAGLSLRYSVNALTGCFVWNGKRHMKTGRAYLRDASGKVVIATRWILGYLRGMPLQGAECALHTCDNPQCVNPSHLFVGTQQDNIRDRDTKGRNRLAHIMCVNGHDMKDPANVHVFGPSGKWRACRACRRDAMARYRAQKRVGASHE